MDNRTLECCSGVSRPGRDPKRNAAGEAMRNAAGKTVRNAAGKAVRNTAGKTTGNVAGEAVRNAAGKEAGNAVRDVGRNTAGVKAAGLARENEAGIRINLYLSRSGVCSRREADRLVENGLVQVDGAAAVPGMRILPGQRVYVEGKPVRPQEKEIWIAVHKPKDVVCTTDRRWGDRLLEDLVDCPQRVFSAGRLDKDSEGLILMTNCGEIAERIMRSHTDHEKEYVVTVDRPLTKRFLAHMEKGVYLKELERVTDPCKVDQTGEYEFHIVLTQGLNRQIRRMCRTLGFQVKRLVRIRIMDIWLGELKPGCWRYLKQEEISSMVRQHSDRIG